MLIPLQWLAEYVELPAGTTGGQVAADLVRVGLEEEGLFGGEVTGPLVVGRVLEVNPEAQKNGKTINWCQVDVGYNGQRLTDDTPQGIVCGAHNFAVGDLVAVILPGGVLPGDFVISARKTYGHVSAGMICSAKELGLGQESDGIIVLGEYFGDEALSLQPGDNLISTFGLDQETVEINVTPDRGYCFSLRGVAREYGHSTGASFTDPAHLTVDSAGEGGFGVELRDEAPIHGVPGCDRYVARAVRGLNLSAPTPAWMATRLTQAGMRPISLAVDVTNYVMLALGQPLHAFDLDTLTGPIVVRRARVGEKLTTLDDVTRSLHTDDLLITDGGDSVLALAGVMGGESSEVSDSTTSVLIESAHFDARSIGRTARRHRLPSEAAKRFERGVDPNLSDAAAQMAVNLLVEFGGGTADQHITDADERIAQHAFDLELTLVSRYVGVNYSVERVIEVLENIGCLVQVSPDAATVSVLPPSWRPDLTDPTDLVEEVARIDGYDKIPSIVPSAPGGCGLTHHQRLRRAIAAALAGQGLSEVLTYPFVGTKRFDDLGLAKDDPRRDAVVLANPLSDEAPLMRTELLQTLPDTLRRNISRGAKDVALFEIDTLSAATSASAPAPPGGVLPDDGVLAKIRGAVPHQPWRVAMIASGSAERGGWWGAGRSAQASDAVAWARSVAAVAGLHDVHAITDSRMPFHPGRCVRLELSKASSGSGTASDAVSGADGDDGSDGDAAVVLGWAGELHPKVVAALGVPARTVAAEVDIDVVAAMSTDRFIASPISTQPQATSDVALTVARTVPNAAVAASLRAGAGQLLESIALFDVYEGDQIDAAAKSLAFRLVFRASDRTLRTEEVNEARDAAIAQAAADHEAVQRA